MPRKRCPEPSRAVFIHTYPSQVESSHLLPWWTSRWPSFSQAIILAALVLKVAQVFFSASHPHPPVHSQDAWNCLRLDSPLRRSQLRQGGTDYPAHTHRAGNVGGEGLEHKPSLELCSQAPSPAPADHQADSLGNLVIVFPLGSLSLIYPNAWHIAGTRLSFTLKVNQCMSYERTEN